MSTVKELKNDIANLQQEKHELTLQAQQLQQQAQHFEHEVLRTKAQAFDKQTALEAELGQYKNLVAELGKVLNLQNGESILGAVQALVSEGE